MRCLEERSPAIAAARVAGPGDDRDIIDEANHERRERRIDLRSGGPSPQLDQTASIYHGVSWFYGAHVREQQGINRGFVWYMLVVRSDETPRKSSPISAAAPAPDDSQSSFGSRSGAAAENDARREMRGCLT
jgi:hypothetical protein